MRPACARLEVPSVGEARAEPSRESSPGSAAARWPAGAGATRAHRGSGASTRPFHAAFACVWRPRALSSTSASVCRHEHNHGPLEPPCRRQVARPGGCFFASPPVSRGVAQPPKRGRVRGRENRTSTLSVAIARAGDFAPTPIASGSSCRERRSLPGSGGHGERTASPSVRSLARRAHRRVVRCRGSAKNPDTHQPEGPSIAGRLESSRMRRLACRSWPGRGPRLFHHRRFRTRDARTGSRGSASRRGGMETIRSLAG